jgi:hypothetical protein
MLCAVIQRLDDRRCHAQCDSCAANCDVQAATVAVAADVLRASGWSVARAGGATCVRCAARRHLG